jgi:hypothetical protein
MKADVEGVLAELGGVTTADLTVEGRVVVLEHTGTITTARLTSELRTHIPSAALRAVPVLVVCTNSGSHHHNSSCVALAAHLDKAQLGTKLTDAFGPNFDAVASLQVRDMRPCLSLIWWNGPTLDRITGALADVFPAGFDGLATWSLDAQRDLAAVHVLRLARQEPRWWSEFSRACRRGAFGAAEDLLYGDFDVLDYEVDGARATDRLDELTLRALGLNRPWAAVEALVWKSLLERADELGGLSRVRESLTGALGTTMG